LPLERQKQAGDIEPRGPVSARATHDETPTRCGADAASVTLQARGLPGQLQSLAIPAGEDGGSVADCRIVVLGLQGNADFARHTVPCEVTKAQSGIGQTPLPQQLPIVAVQRNERRVHAGHKLLAATALGQRRDASVGDQQSPCGESHEGLGQYQHLVWVQTVGGPFGQFLHRLPVANADQAVAAALVRLGREERLRLWRDGQQVTVAAAVVVWPVPAVDAAAWLPVQQPVARTARDDQHTPIRQRLQPIGWARQRDAGFHLPSTCLRPDDARKLVVGGLPGGQQTGAVR